MAQAQDKTLMLAEICWIRSVSPSARALASNAPVTVSSVLNNDMLFAAEDYFLFDETRRCVFCWADEWEADQSKEIWRFVPAGPSFTDFYILNVHSQEYLFASNVAALECAEGYGEKRAFTWRGATGSAFRRLVLTSKYRPLDQSWNECHTWGIKPAAPSLLERGLDAFFVKDYTAAVDLFTSLLDTEKPSPAASIKVYWYRMVANLKLQKKELFRRRMPKFFLEVTKDVLGEDLTVIESTELAQYVRSK
ncbi:Serine/threonine-protein phosphatase 2A regulatory subunit B'' subunit gamma [Phytophthora nicotianae]|uniref:Serine/threonine-protein phosphatase 2A regulatory subunit B'' subunit gamma n=1 Tax=Phytophthora nicotianae TaxID=4792 RepID=A0A0W8DHG0_PHYNI|nr:Serine/threonine-protein phosphatase 2A regulatory subunit B'' subunit gamma [Phytophthora nicotianae]